MTQPDLCFTYVETEAQREEAVDLPWALQAVTAHVSSLPASLSSLTTPSLLGSFFPHAPSLLKEMVESSYLKLNLLT